MSHQTNPSNKKDSVNTRVILADDHSLVRADIHKFLERAGDIKIVGEADNGREVLALVEKLQPDVLILDMEMPDLKGFEIIQRLQAEDYPVHILAFSTYNDRQYMLKTLDYGAAGYLPKDASPQTIVDTVRRLAHPPQDAEDGSWPPPPDLVSPPPVQLTDDEIEVLRLVVGGKTVQQISLDLNLSEELLQRMIEVIFSKLEVQTSFEAAGKAVQQGLI